MATFGSIVFWGPGVFWGEAYEAAATRLLYMTRMGPNFRKWADITDSRWATLFGVLEEVLQAFDLETCSGNSLDIIGASLYLERQETEDERYRRALRTQRLVLNTKGTNPDLLNVWGAWLETPPLAYSIPGPATVEIAGVVDPEDEVLLARFLRSTAPAGVVLSVHTAASTFLICDSITNPLTAPGVCDAIITPVPGAPVLTTELITP